MIGVNLAALQVVIPLIGAPLCVLFGHGTRAWMLSTAITWCAFMLSVSLLIEVLCCGTVSYVMGGWFAPWGIEYRVDYLSALMLLLITGVASAVMPFTFHSVTKEIPQEKHRLFYTTYLLTFTGLLGMVVTGDAFNAFVFMEIASLSAYVLISLGQDRRALYASFQYLILGTIGATFFVIGVGLLYMLTGTLNMVDLSQRLSGQHDNRVLLAAFSFLVVGLSLKLALFPLHLWLPNSYAYAPTAIAALLAATGTKVSIYLLLRFSFTVLQVDQHVELLPVMDALFPLAVIAMLAGSIVAVYQTNLKRLLAYSSVAQIGYILLGIALASEHGLVGAIVHVFNHGVMKAALFVIIGAVALHSGGGSVRDLTGLGKRMPLTMAAFLVAMLSLIGIPGTVGFISKWYLVLAALEAGTPKGIFAAAAVISATLLAIVYVWRLVEVAYFTNSTEIQPPAREEASWPVLISISVLAGSCVIFGTATDLTIGLSRLAAQMLLGAG